MSRPWPWMWLRRLLCGHLVWEEPLLVPFPPARNCRWWRCRSCGKLSEFRLDRPPINFVPEASPSRKVPPVSMKAYACPRCLTLSSECEDGDGGAHTCTPTPLVRDLESRVEALRAWKTDALKALNALDIQEIGKELGVPLGSDIGPQILPGIRALKERVAALEELLLPHLPASVRAVETRIRVDLHIPVSPEAQESLRRALEVDG